MATDIATLQHNKSCRETAEEIIEFCGERPPRFWAELARLANEKLPQSQTAKVTATPPAPRRGITVNLGPSLKLAQELIEDIRELAGDMPDRGLEFAESVVARTDGIAETIDTNASVTAAQITALQNMANGLRAWIH